MKKSAKPSTPPLSLSPSKRKYLLWMPYKRTGSYVKYLKDDYERERKYLNSLSPEDQIWLNNFLRAYYGIEPKFMELVKMPVMMRRSRYNQHVGVKRDIYTNRSPCSLDGQSYDFESAVVSSWTIEYGGESV